jgi:hypothetical protein
MARSIPQRELKTSDLDATHLLLFEELVSGREQGAD